MATQRYVLMPYGHTVLVTDGEDGFLIASCPELPGCHSQGRTLRETLNNIEDAVIGYLAILSEEDHAAERVDASNRIVSPAFTDVSTMAAHTAWGKTA